MYVVEINGMLASQWKAVKQIQIPCKKKKKKLQNELHNPE